MRLRRKNVVMLAEHEGDGAAEASSKALKSYAGVHVARFTVVDVLGDGPIARVFRVEDIESSRHIALKVFKQKIRFQGKQYRTEQLAQQARAAAALEHAGIIAVNEIGEESDVYHVAMEWAAEGSLREIVQRQGPLPIRDACGYVAQVAKALAYTHGRGILHRDIKPSNLLICSSGRCKLSDFGMAPTIDSGHLYTLPLEALGRPRYVAPEVLLGERPTARADIYSLGAVLYFLLAGRPAFEGETFEEVREQQCSSVVPNLCTVRPDLPGDLMSIIRHAMAKFPQQRFADAAQFAQAVHEQMAQIPAPPVPVIEPHDAQSDASRAGFPRNVTTGALTVLALAILIVGAVLTLRLLALPSDIIAESSKGPARIVTPSEATDSGPGGTDLDATRGTRLITATDIPSLLAAASASDSNGARSQVTVEGRVVRAVTSATEESVGLSFAEGDTGFRCVYYPAADMFRAMSRKLGGPNGVGVEGKMVRVTGAVMMSKGRPQIILSSPDQIEELK